ncbi:Endosulfine-domain-containing protein [Flagelloscypha sp. PMI_526]|nr:Endosulfine-domain-containing protein [Flagelloscypha sp. PMI_526]
MIPAQRKKADLGVRLFQFCGNPLMSKPILQGLSEQEKQLFAKYGKLPTHKNMLTKMQKERKYFDSGDYALSKAGVAPQSTVGTAIPNPENIPHASSPSNSGHSSNGLSISPTHPTSPIKESGLAQSQAAIIDEVTTQDDTEPTTAASAAE